MSTGCAATPLLKAAPEPDQIADRLDGGPWRGLELCLMPSHVASSVALARAIEATRDSLDGRDAVVIAEAPVSWPSGAHVRVDRLDDEARAGIERSVEFAAAVDSAVLTIHLLVPTTPEEYRRSLDGPDLAEIGRFLHFYADACLARGVTPLIENVPPVLRMRTGGFFLSAIGGRWRDLLEWRDRVPQLGFTLDISHAALFRNFAAAYPSIFDLYSDDELELERYVEELGPASEVAHVSDAFGLLGEGLPYGSGELDGLDAVVRRVGGLVRYVVAEINEPDPVRSPDMKAGYRALEQTLAQPAVGPPAQRRRRPRPEHFDWQRVLGARDPVPSVLELQELFGGRRVLITGGGGSIGGVLATLLDGFRPERITLLDSHEAALTMDRRGRDRAAVERISHVLCDIRDAGRLETEFGRARPDMVFHLAAYKHVDWAMAYPEEFVDNNLHGSWNVLGVAERAGVDTVVMASTDKAAFSASFYGRIKRFTEQLTAYAARRAGAHRVAVRFVNVLSSRASVSELFLRQARDNVPLTVTDSGMVRYWITIAHAATLAAHSTLLAREDVMLAGPSNPTILTVGELAKRIWLSAGREGAPDIDLIGIRRDETLAEILTACGEHLGEERFQGIAPIHGEIPITAPAWVAERLPATGGYQEARAVWFEAMRRSGLLAAPSTITDRSLLNRPALDVELAPDDPLGA